MPFIKLQFRPGINRDQTNYTNEGGWFACDKIRFRSGYPQKLGGWVRSTSQTFVGVCRQLFGYITSFSDNFLAMGTSKKVYINVGSTNHDITPLRNTTVAGAVTFSAVTTAPYSSIITVNNLNANVDAGDFVKFNGAASLGGNITAAVLNQEYEVYQSISANQYTIIAKNPTTGLPVTSNASDIGTGGVNTVGAYQIPIGNDATEYGYGWGAEGWGVMPWGLGSTYPILLPQRDWWFDNFDNDLVMNIRNGAIYYWQRGEEVNLDVSLATRAIELSALSGASDVPIQAMQILVSQNDKHLLAFGCTPFGSSAPADFDPLMIRWASQNAPEFWTPGTVTVPSTGTLSSAGFIRVSRGSAIVRALPTRQTILVWTNSHLYSLQYLGTLDVFSLQEMADNISIISPRAAISANNVTYWMGTDKFYGFTGAVETLPCSLRNHVFGNLNYNQKDQIIAGANEGYHEIWWFYPSKNSERVDLYVIYNYLERIWYYGSLDRTAWLDSPLRNYPQAVGYNNILMDHENGVNADGDPMESYIQSSDFDLGDGDKFILTRRIIPDVNFEGSTAAAPELKFMVKARNFPGSTYQTDSFDTQGVISSSVDVYTQQIWMRARARQMAIKIMSEGIGVNWQLGSPRLDGQPDGSR